MLVELHRHDRPPLFERTHPFAEHSVRMADGSAVPAIQLAARFYETEVGASMPSQPLRYISRFGYDRDQMLDDLGHDLCPMGHQMELVYHAGRIIEQEDAAETIYSGLSDEDRGIVALACLLHDIGEVMHQSISDAGFTIVGDIPAGQKTASDRENEALIRKYLYETYFGDVDPVIITRIEGIISHSVKDTLHDLFEAAHAVQTVETSNFAHGALMKEPWHPTGSTFDIPSDGGERLSGLLGIARVAFKRIVPELQAYSHFAHVDEVLERSTTLREPPHRLFH